MELAFNGFHQHITTMEGAVEIGDLVAVSANGQVTKANADQDFVGICVSKRDQLAGIQLYGTAEIAYTGTAPALGYTGLTCAGNNAVKASANGRKLLVLSVDSAAARAVIIL